MQLLLGIFLLVSGQFEASNGPQLEGVVNINAASPEELGLLPGIGPSRVRNILAYRQAHPFRTVEELARIKGIGRKTIRRFRSHLATSGPTTIQKVLRPPASATPAPAAPQTTTVKTIPRPPVPSVTRPLVSVKAKPGPIRDHARHAIGNHCLSQP